MGAVFCCMKQQPSPKDDYQLMMSNSNHSVSAAETPFADDAKSVAIAKTPEKRHDLESGTSVEKKYTMIGSMTLQDYLLASPNVNVNPPRNRIGGEIQIFKNLPRKLCPASSASPEDNVIEGNNEFFTPIMNFSPADHRLGVMEDETHVVGNLSTESIVSRNASGKLGKKVRFRMPEVADIYLYYTPKETFEDE